MPLPNSNWITTYPASQDNLGANQPDQVQDSYAGAQDGNRMLITHIHVLRDKLDAVANKVGDNSNLPAGCYGARISALESAGPGGQTNTVGGATGITNTGDNVDAVLAPTYGSSANTVCEGNDARLSDARTPTGHKTSHEPGGADAMAVDAAAATGSLRTLGTGAAQACAGDDGRLSDARTPTSHASSHKSAGGDSIKLDELAAPTDVTTLDADTGKHGLLPKLGGGTTNFLRADGSWAAPPGGGASAWTALTDTPGSISAKQPVEGDAAGTALTFGPLNKRDATIAPTVNDDNTAGYGVQSRWSDVTADKEYVCLDATTGAAVWTETTGGGGGSSTFLALTDTPSSYASQAGKIPVVNGGETALEFQDRGSWAPGEFVEALLFEPGGNVTTASTSFVDLTGASGTFEVDFAGDFLLQLALNCFSPNAGTVTIFRVIIDAGLPGEKIVGSDDRSWRATHNVANFQIPMVQQGVLSELTAGSHTVKVQWKVGSGTSYFNAGSWLTVKVQAITGSGAGGTLAQSTLGTTTPTDASSYVSGASPAFKVIADLEQTVVVAGPNDVVGVKFVARLDPLTNGGTWLYPTVFVDGVNYFGGMNFLTATYSTSTSYNKILSFGVDLTGLSAGSHTINIAIAKFQTGSVDWNVVVPRLFTTIYRGGLVPIKQDGTLVQDKPQALNFINAEVVNDNGEVDITLPAAVTAPGNASDVEQIPVGTVTVNSDSSWTLLTPNSGSSSLTALVAGLHHLTWDILVYTIFNATNVNFEFKVVIDEGTGEEQTIGGTGYWRYRTAAGLSTGIYVPHRFEDLVTLTAGAHTFKGYARGTGAASQGSIGTNTNTGARLALTAITGSGAGGVLIDINADTTFAALCTNLNEWYNLTNTDVTINQVAGEQFSLVGMVSGRPDSSLVRWQVRIYDVTGAAELGAFSPQVESPTLQYGSATVIAAVENAVAGPRTYRLQVRRTAGTGTFKCQGALRVEQYRGGLVPIKQDGTLVQDKPQAINFINAEVVNDNGEVDITLPAAVTAPGEVVEALVNSAITATTTSSTFEDMTGASDSFETRGAGVFLVDLAVWLWGTVSAPVPLGFQLVFDAGTPNEQTVGPDDPSWQFYLNQLAESDAPRFTTVVTLAAGSHTVKVRWKRVSGSGTGNCSVAKVMLLSAGASGAGGTLGANSVLAVTYPLTASYADTGIEVPITVAEGEYIDVRTVLTAYTEGADGFAQYKIVSSVDGDLFTTGEWGLGPTSYKHENHSFVRRLGPLTAGSHTIKLQAQETTTTAGQLASGSLMEVVQFRGGLVPIKQDGTLVQDKPQAINAIGPGLQATNVAGQVNLSVQSAAEGVETSVAALSTTRTIVATSLSPIPTEPLTLTFDANPGETVLIGAEFNASVISGGPNDYAALYVDGSVASVSLRTGMSTLPQERSLLVPYTLPGGSGTSHTLELYCNTLGGTSWSISGGAKISATRFRGGYVVPENIPILAYNSASVINVAAAPGAPSALSAQLNDGIRRRATAPLTINLSTLGEGGRDTGSEAVSTWYYNYLVPTAADDTVMCGVCSVTDPDSGGPTGYNAWKYIGAVYNQSDGHLRKWYQSGNRFDYSYWVDGIASAALGVGAHAKMDFDLSDVVPVTATGMVFHAAVRHSTAAGNSFSQQLFVYGAPSLYVYTLASYTAYQLVQSNGIIPLAVAQKIQYESTQDGGTHLGQWVYTQGWIDGWLSPSSAQTQAKYQADTATPKGTWATVSTVNFAARPGQPATSRLTFQDGKSRIASGTLAWAIANGVADLGYDEAGSQGNSKWLYFYAVPKSGDDNLFTIRASDNPPTTGPAGYTNWKMVWSTYIDGSGNLLKVIQSGSRFNWAEVLAPALSVTTKTHYDASAYVPETAALAMVMLRADYSAAAAQLSVYPTGATAHMAFAYCGDGTQANGTTQADIPVGGSPRGFDYALSGTGAVGNFYFQGWIDEWIAP